MMLRRESKVETLVDFLLLLFYFAVRCSQVSFPEPG